MLRIITISSPRSGRPVANQIILETDDLRIFFSYGTLIAVQYASGFVKISARYYRYSRTTSRYLAQFLGVKSAEIQRRVSSGMYQLDNLQQFRAERNLFKSQAARRDA